MALFKSIRKKKIGKPSIVICLDSGCGNYEQLWCTVSLRGVINGILTAQLLKEGIHSGGSGLARDSFHIIRELLNRIDNIENGEMCKDLQVEIPLNHQNYALETAKVLGKEIYSTIPFVNKLILPQIDRTKYEQNEEKELKELDEQELTKLLLQSIWKPQLTITGVDGIPDLKGGNVLRKETSLKLSIRLPPSLDSKIASEKIKQILENNPPYHSNVKFNSSVKASGFVCPEFDPWLLKSLHDCSKLFYNNKSCCFLGEGGTIPLMGQLLEIYPSAQFIIVGVLGPNSNAHGPNEFLHIQFTKKLICCMSYMIHIIAQRSISKLQQQK